jgi:predicted MPP superfamily phosphohydrolase
VGRTAVTRRKFITNSLAAVAGIALPTAGYAQFVEPHRLSVTSLDFRIPNLPDAFDGFRVAQLSDFHYGIYTGADEIAESVALANSLHPDLIVLTGDYITAPDEEKRPPATDPVFSEIVQCARILSALHAPHGVLGCLGNHDAVVDPQYFHEVFLACGMRLLRNSSAPIERSGKRLWLAGIDDALFGKPDFSAAIRDVPPGEVAILLAHEPDVADQVARYPFAVQLSGHSHGGQVRLPLITSHYLPPLARKYPFGFYRIKNLQLYTNRGIGTIMLPYRFNAPPEVTLITLHAVEAMGEKGRS